MLFRSFLMLMLLVLVVRAIWRLVGGVVEGASGAGPSRPTAPSPTKMVRDPICGTYVVPGKAIALGRGGETQYFCSDKCRDEWSRRA